MFFQKIESKGLAHYSYFVGNDHEAFVIDPRRDPKVYLDVAMEGGFQITHIFETHRNEDYVTGSMELAELTGATIHISGHEELGYVYGEKISDGDTFTIGDLTVKAIHTPGHTLGHMSYALYDKGKDSAMMLFSGDCLFMGGVGRTDFYGEENLEKMTGLLYESIFKKLLPLGDEVLLFPAHGAGSACGDDMDERPFSTLGYERKHNPALIQDKDKFIQENGTMRIKPRYFEVMEVYNTKGAPFIHGKEEVLPVSIEENKQATQIDIRSRAAFFGKHNEGAYAVGLKQLSTYLGTLFETDTPLILVTDDPTPDALKNVKAMLYRIGFDHLLGFAQEGVTGHEKMETITPEEALALPKDVQILDVRLESTVPEKIKVQTIHIPLQILYKEYEKIDPKKKVYTLCVSGERANIAAAFLKNLDYEVAVIDGGMKE